MPWPDEPMEKQPNPMEDVAALATGKKPKPKPGPVIGGQDPSRMEAIRARALEGLGSYTQAMGEAPETIRKAALAARATMGQRVGEAIGTQLGKAGAMPSGGGALAGLSQVALNQGIAEGDEAAKYATAAKQAEAEAGKAQATAYTQAKAIGSLEEDRAKKRATYDQGIANILSGVSWYGGTSRADAEKQIRSMIADETDPVIREAYEHKIETLWDNW